MTNLIQGRIAVHGFGTGVPDLLVVIYDVDPSKLAGNEGGPSSFDDNIAALFANRAQRTWLEFPGDRLGSVLTDSRGRFKLEYEDSQFRQRNNERRPDLLLFVLAPQYGVGSTPVGVPPLERLLHFAAVPRANAGRVESYSIAIKPEMLARFEVRYPGLEGSAQAHLQHLQFSLQQDDERRESKRAIMAPYIARRQAQQARLAAVRETSWRWLSMPVAETAALFQAPGTSATTLSEEARELGADRLVDYHGSGRIRLVPQELERLRIRPEELDDGASISVSLCDLLALKGFGSSLVRVRSLLDGIRARRQADAALSESAADGGEDDDAGPGPGPGPGPEDSEDIEDIDPGEFITRRVLGQIRDLPTLDSPGSPSPIEELAKIKETINALELAGGPANATAFQDFYTLQVAWKHVWTAAFDERLRDQAVALYEEATKLHDDYGVEIPDVDAIQDLNDFREFLSAVDSASRVPEILAIPPDVRQCWPQLDMVTWNRLDDDGRNILQTAAGNHLLPWSRGDDIHVPPSEWATQEYLDRQYEQAMQYHMNTPLARVQSIVLDIRERLREPYAFQYFAPYTVNFAILTTVRQKLVREAEQVGRMVATVPLAPGEERTLKVTETVNRSRAQKQIEKSIVERQSESQRMSRAELDVMAKTAMSTNFRMTAQGSLSLGIGSLTTTSEFGINQQNESSRQAKEISEATQKASQLTRQEREVHVEVAAASTASTEGTHKLTNLNNELTVTYLLYELERRFRVTTALHRVQPVILIARDVPPPHVVSSPGWLLEHASVIKRCLLDDWYLDAFPYIESGALAADSMDIEIKKANWTTQKALVDRLEGDLAGLLGLRDLRRQELIRVMERRDRAEAGESDADDAAAAIFSGGLSLLFGSSRPDASELLEARRKAIETTLEYLAEQVEGVQGQLSAARGVLQQAADDYSAALKERERSRTVVDALGLHVRQNILHYMHHIWEAMHPDQLALELFHREVDVLEPEGVTCTLRRARPEERAAPLPRLHRDGEEYVVECAPPLRRTDPAIRRRTVRKQLVEIADLEHPLGFKGNYVIFPLKGCTYITDFMMQEYVDDYFGLRDPANPDGYATDELLRYAAELWHDPSAELTADEREALRALVIHRLGSESLEDSTIILPTGNLYMEALKGEQALLEDFKLAHRGLDVLKVKEEIIRARLENCRIARRLTMPTPVLEQGTYERAVLVKDTPGMVVPVGDES